MTPAPRRVSFAVIGDALIDEIHHDSTATEFIGGSALNVAVGLASLGRSTRLLAMVGSDAAGDQIRAHLASAGVDLIATAPSAPATGRAISRRGADGEPAYAFDAAARGRRLPDDSSARTAIDDSQIIVVSGFPFDDAAQVHHLHRSLSERGDRLLLLDPNPRAGLLASRADFIVGLERMAAIADLVKISDDDADLLYGWSAQRLRDHLLDIGTRVVLSTAGPGGATLSMAGGTWHVPIAELTGPIIDTMGAGDATLATIAAALTTGMPESDDAWRDIIARAMRVAAATCRSAGPALRLPRLSAATVPLLPADVLRPPYRDRAPQQGIAHIGVGNFHRSHQAMYLDRVLTADPAAAWSICGIGVRPEDRDLLSALQEQDGLYSLSLFHPGGHIETRVLGAMSEFIADDPDRALARLTDPAIRIVSLTVTEGGYVEDPAAGRRAADDVGIRADVAGGLTAPRTTFGLIVAALRARRAQGTAPFTVLSCDNILQNGAVARASTVATARLVDEGLATWIDAHVDFPSTMVDRITPGATDAQRLIVTERLDMYDAAPVVAEPYEQWVLEDDFRAGRPALETVGAVFTTDIAAYEEMKLRLLNGGHQVLAYAGLVRGYVFAHQAMSDAEVRARLERYWHALALPALTLPPGVVGAEYLDALVDRFSNSAIADTLERLATDSAVRMGGFVLPVLERARATAGTVDASAEILASWAHAMARTPSTLLHAGVPADALRAMRAGDADFLTRLGWESPLTRDEALRDAVARLLAQ